MVADPIQEIKDQADIVELISEIIPVKRSGANYLAVCPFHNDTKPSMYISPQKGIFKCFACGAGGDLFKFWSEYYQKDFKETLKDLAEKYGVTLNYSEENKANTEKFNLSVKMHELAANYYHEQLLASNQAQAARDYLASRQISTATIAEYKIGFSPFDKGSWDRLTKYLIEKLKCSKEQILEAGLALQNEKTGHFYDRFRGRLMIPIYDERGRAIAFGARVMPGEDDKGPKYINSPETAIYHKGTTLFGINLAKEAIRKEDAVIVVEGYFDQISLKEAGIDNTVANQGTALTPKQIKVMSKFSNSKKIFLCFDTDTAGENASDKAAHLIYQILAQVDFELRTIRVPGGKDPDEFIKNNGTEAFRELIKNAPLYIDYKINKIIEATDKTSPQAKAKAVKQISEYLSLINNKIELSEYCKQIVSKLNIDEYSLKQELNINSNQNSGLDSNPYDDDPYQTQKKPEKQKAKSTYHRINGHIIYTQDSIYSCEQEFLLLALRDRSYLEKFLGEDGQLISEKHKLILEALTDISFENPNLGDANEKFKLVSERLFSHQELSSELADLGIKLEQELAKDSMGERYQELLRKLKETRLNQEIKTIKEQMLKLDDSSSEWEEKLKERIAIEKEIQKLK